MTKNRKAIIIGIDSARPDFVSRLVEEGMLPNIARLIKNGVFARAIPPIPHTAPGWATIATGAQPGTHQITQGLHIPGDHFVPIDNDKILDINYCQAEHLWDAAGKVGKKSILLTYPGGGPIKDGINVANWRFSSREVVPSKIFLTKECNKEMIEYFKKLEKEFHQSLLMAGRIPGKNEEIQFTPAKGWKNIHSSGRLYPLETVITMKLSKPSVRFHILLTSSDNSGYDKVIICRNKDTRYAVATLSVGEWSDWIRTIFSTKGGNQICTHRFKLLELSLDARRFKLYASAAYPISGWSDPPSISDELVKNVGPICEHYNPLEWIGEETYLEEIEYQCNWLANAAIYLMSHYDWSLFMMHEHSIDGTTHLCLTHVDPRSPFYNPKRAKKYWRILARNYQIVDKMIGKIVKQADENTIVVVVSDHGNVPPIGDEIFINNLFAKKGLLTYEKDPKTGKISINWKRTKAYAMLQVSIWVNLKGRERNGIVNPGKEYESVRDEIIEILYGLTDSKGKHPIAIALKREDADYLGLNGKWIGDVVYALKPGYAFNPTLTEDGKILRQNIFSRHGPALGSYRDLHGTFIISGPGVKKDRRIKAIQLADIAPTLAYLLGIPNPANAEGRIISEALT